MKKIIAISLSTFLLFGTAEKKASSEIVGTIIVGGALAGIIIVYIASFVNSNKIQKEHDVLVKKVMNSNIIHHDKQFPLVEFMNKISHKVEWINSISHGTDVTCITITQYTNPKTFTTETLYLQFYFYYNEQKNESRIKQIVNLKTGEYYSTPEGVDYVTTFLLVVK